MNLTSKILISDNFAKSKINKDEEDIWTKFLLNALSAKSIDFSKPGFNSYSMSYNLKFPKVQELPPLPINRYSRLT